jgi:hypothetical protein
MPTKDNVVEKMYRERRTRTEPLFKEVKSHRTIYAKRGAVFRGGRGEARKNSER